MRKQGEQKGRLEWSLGMFELPGEGVWTLLLGQDDFRAGRGLGFGKYCVAALCKVAELGKVTEGRALVSILKAQARSHGGLDGGRWWSRDKRKDTGIEDPPEAGWTPHAGLLLSVSAVFLALSRLWFFTLDVTHLLAMHL